MELKIIILAAKSIIKLSQIFNKWMADHVHKGIRIQIPCEPSYKPHTHKHSLSNSLCQAAVRSIAAICPVLAADPGISANTSLRVLRPQPAQTGMQNFAQFLARESVQQRM